MPDNKVADLNEEKDMWRERRAYLDKMTSEYNAQISTLQNQQKELAGERSAAQQQYQDALQQPHAKLDQLLGAQDKMKEVDENLEKTAKSLAGTTTELRETIQEQAEVDTTIKRLDDKIETTQNIDAFKEKAAPYAKLAVGAAAAYALNELEDAGIHTESVKQAFEWGKLHFENTIGSREQKGAENGQTPAENSANADPKLENDKAFHSAQLAAVDQFKTEVNSQIDASRAEMQKVMGHEWSVAGQKEFAQNEFNSAFQKTNDFVAHQVEERQQFFANNKSTTSPLEQEVSQAGMNTELQQAHYGLTRGLAEKQAGINVDLANQEMRQLQEKRLEGSGVSQEQMSNEMKPLNNLLTEQRPNDVYMEANKIHSQQSPEMAMTPPSMAPQQSGPAGPGQ